MLFPVSLNINPLVIHGTIGIIEGISRPATSHIPPEVSLPAQRTPGMKIKETHDVEWYHHDVDTYRKHPSVPGCKKQYEHRHNLHNNPGNQIRKDNMPLFHFCLSMLLNINLLSVIFQFVMFGPNVIL